MKSLKGKLAAVTGAGSGIGRAVAIDLARRGCRVAASDIQADAVAETVRLIKSAKGDAKAYSFDVADREAFYQHAAAVTVRSPLKDGRGTSIRISWSEHSLA